VPLAGVIVTSWLTAFVEYCLAVPANRWGSAVHTTAQLNTIQEVITLVVFTGFSMLYLKEPLTWNVGISHSGTMTVAAITALPAIMDVYRSMLMAVRSEAGRFSPAE
jgi:uncharacterized protein (DUF486 family)